MRYETEEIAALLRRYRFSYADERALQDGIDQVLRDHGILFLREERLTARDRVDFLADRVAVEVKVAGNRESLIRQIGRYAKSDRVDGIVVVTSRAWRAIPAHVDGKPVSVVSLALAAL